MREYIGFWLGGENTSHNEFLYDYFNKENNYVIIAQSVTQQQIDKIKDTQKRILLFTERPSQPCRRLNFDLYNNNSYDLAYGNIPHEPSLNRIKLPEYFLCVYNNCRNLNNTVANRELPHKEAILIARHDKWETRTPAYDACKDIGLHVTCPSNLYNNYNNADFEKVGLVNFCQNYRFKICSENYMEGSYVTEKLGNCFNSNCIPIYCGGLDDIDREILNMNRIIFYDPHNPEQIRAKLWKLKDPIAFEQFYRQPIFNDGADEIIKSHVNKIRKFFD